jgi:hypothetical protein
LSIHAYSLWGERSQQPAASSQQENQKPQELNSGNHLEVDFPSDENASSQHLDFSLVRFLVGSLVSPGPGLTSNLQNCESQGSFFFFTLIILLIIFHIFFYTRKT